MNHFENVTFSIREIAEVIITKRNKEREESRLRNGEREYNVPIRILDYDPDDGISDDEFLDRELPYHDMYSYDVVLDHFAGVVGGDIVVQVEDKDYQGDTNVLFKSGEGFYGILNFGWGSCSGCDWLQGCNSWTELQELYNDLWRDIVWYETAQECLDYIGQKDWELDSSWHASELKDFLKQCKESLQKAIDEHNPAAVAKFQEECEDALFEDR